MKRFVRLALTSVIFASLAVLAPTPPPSSALNACVETATVVLSNGHGLPVLTSNTASFSVHPLVVCAPTSVPAEPWSGFVTGACGSAVGFGARFGASFSLTIIGATFVVTGAMNGSGLIVEDPFDAGSCTNKTATRFLLTSVYLTF